jgi:nuclear transport factor 2 (NTF2) superfamily protein
VPLFDESRARHEVQAAEGAWNTRDPARVVGAYTADSVWRESLWAFGGDRIAVRGYGSENWEFDAHGYMKSPRGQHQRHRHHGRRAAPHWAAPLRRTPPHPPAPVTR